MRTDKKGLYLAIGYLRYIILPYPLVMLDRLLYNTCRVTLFEKVHIYNKKDFERDRVKAEKQKALSKFKREQPDEYHRIQTLIKD